MKNRWSQISKNKISSEACVRTRSEPQQALKKKLQWYTTFGPIIIEQQVLRRPGKGARVHPFRDFANVSHRSCSRMLRRRIVDFSAERSFAQTAQALVEHYRIEVPRYCIDKVTAQVCREAKAHNSSKPQTITSAKVLISEVDGSMLPIINTDPPKGAENKDRRKHRNAIGKNSESAPSVIPTSQTPITEWRLEDPSP
jgi:hypothetical protein